MWQKLIVIGCPDEKKSAAKMHMFKLGVLVFETWCLWLEAFGVFKQRRHAKHLSLRKHVTRDNWMIEGMYACGRVVKMFRTLEVFNALCFKKINSLLGTLMSHRVQFWVRFCFLSSGNRSDLSDWLIFTSVLMTPKQASHLFKSSAERHGCYFCS